MNKRKNDTKKCAQYVCTHSLTHTQLQVLAKGLKYIPTPTTTISEHIQGSIANDLRRQFYSSKRPQRNYQPHPFKQPSTWQVPKAHPEIEQFISALKTNTDNLPSPHSHPNLTREQKQVLRELSGNSNLNGRC